MNKISLSRSDYLISQKVIHWLMAFLIILDLNIAQKFGGEMELWDRLESRVDHATVGILVTVLFIFRIILRYMYGAPALPNSMPNWQKFSAKIGHYGLYFFITLLIFTGIASAYFTSDPIVVFGSLNLSSETDSQGVFQLIRGAHEFSTNAVIFLIFVHILASIYHHFIAKDKTTVKMLKFWKPVEVTYGAGITWNQWVFHPKGGNQSESSLKTIIESNSEDQRDAMGELYRKFTDQVIGSMAALGAP